MNTTVYAASGGDYSDYRIYAIFTTREEAQKFVDNPDSYADRVESMPLYEQQPKRYTVYVIERIGHQPVHRRSELVWEFDGMGYTGEKRQAWNYSKWQRGERAFGRDKGAVEKAWKEAHAAEEARDAGL